MSALQSFIVDRLFDTIIHKSHIWPLSCLRTKGYWLGPLGHTLRLEGHRVIRQELMNCVRPTPNTFYYLGLVPDLDSRKPVAAGMCESGVFRRMQ